MVVTPGMRGASRMCLLNNGADEQWLVAANQRQWQSPRHILRRVAFTQRNGENESNKMSLII